MPSERLSSSEKRALLLWILLGIVGAFYAHRYYFQAFPEASINFKVSRPEALNRARAFVQSLGTDVSAYRSSILFNLDDNSKTYLERKMGLRRANELMSSELDIWYWDVRFFVPQQVEEFRVRVSLAGNIVGYDHKIEEARAGASLDRAAAQTLAQTVLTEKFGWNASGWNFLPEEANSEQRPNRVDWSFTWEKRDFRAQDAPYRLGVTLHGDQLGDESDYLQVPEAWSRSYTRLRSGNDTLAEVFTVPYLLLLGAALWLGIKLTLQGQTSWRGAIILGCFVAALLFLQNLNDWPHWGAGYDTTDSYPSFLVGQIGTALVIAILTAITVTLVLPAAEPLYRASQPARLRLSQVLTTRGLRSKEFFSSAIVGLSLAAAHIGFIVAFYIVASKLGAWAPQDVSYDNAVNTAFPWISGVAIGLLASTNEEFTFRLFAIPFFKRITGLRWIAVIVPAFLWSFLHSNYPQEPAYIRGIEVGLIGIVAGLVMLRWGIFATLIWHYTVDASLVGLLLLRSNSLYFKISGAVVGAAAVAPLAFAGVSYLFRGQFEPVEDLLNSAIPAPEITFQQTVAPAPVAADRKYTSLAPGMLAFLMLCFLAGGILTWRFHPQSIGDYLKLSVDARMAGQDADAILRSQAVDPASYHHATTFVINTDPVINEFLRQHIGIADTNKVYAGQVPGGLWRIRYFRDSQPDEYAVILKPDGSLHSIHHTLAEDATGASLTKDNAQSRAEAYLRDTKKIDLSQWNLVEATSDKRPNRTDHTFTWQQKTPLDSTSTAAAPDNNEHAFARIELQVLGDEVCSYRTYIKIPDDWRRKQEETPLYRALFNYRYFLCFGILGLAAFIIFLKNIRSETAHSIPWKRLVLWSSWILLGYFLVILLGNRIATFLSAYNTAIPLKIYLGELGIGVLLGVPFYFGGLTILSGLAWYFASRAFGTEQIPRWRNMPAAYYRDALWIGLGGAGALLGLAHLLEVAALHWNTAHRAIDSSFGTSFDAILPAGAIFGSTLIRGLFLAALIALLASFIASQLRPRWTRFVVFILGVLVLMGASWGSAADFAKQFVVNLILLTVIVFGVRRVMRFNLLGCFLTIATLVLLPDATEFLRQPNAFYHTNGYGLLLILLCLLAWPAYLWGRPPATSS